MFQKIKYYTMFHLVKMQNSSLSKSAIEALPSILILIISLIISLFMYNIIIGTHKSDAFYAVYMMAGSINGKFLSHLQKKKIVISILINNLCNLSCKHCFLQSDKFDSYLKREDWEKFFESAFTDLKPGTISFAGKEVFYDKESAEILFSSIHQRNSIQKKFKDKTQIGVITNGTLLHNFKDILVHSWPDYFDISIDGLPHIHDQIRGKGAFKSLEKDLMWLHGSFPGNIWIVHTVMQNNFDSIPEFIQFIYKRFGLTKFAIGLYKEMDYTDQNFKLNNSNISALFNKTLKQLSELKLAEPIDVIMEFDYTQKDFLNILLNSGLIDPKKQLSSTSYHYSNGLNLEIDIANIPVGFWRAIRITPEGYWLAAEDLMEVKHYNKFAVANLKELNFNSLALYEAGISSKRYFELITGYESLIEHYFSEKLK